LRQQTKFENYFFVEAGDDVFFAEYSGTSVSTESEAHFRSIDGFRRVIPFSQLSMRTIEQINAGRKFRSLPNSEGVSEFWVAGKVKKISRGLAHVEVTDPGKTNGDKKSDVGGFYYIDPNNVLQRDRDWLQYFLTNSLEWGDGR
jgi:hypothetical protein